MRKNLKDVFLGPDSDWDPNDDGVRASHDEREANRVRAALEYGRLSSFLKERHPHVWREFREDVERGITARQWFQEPINHGTLHHFDWWRV